jgi:hypothetical protein
VSIRMQHTLKDMIDQSVKPYRRHGDQIPVQILQPAESRRSIHSTPTSRRSCSPRSLLYRPARGRIMKRSSQNKHVLRTPRVPEAASASLGACYQFLAIKSCHVDNACWDPRCYRQQGARVVLGIMLKYLREWMRPQRCAGINGARAPPHRAAAGGGNCPGLKPQDLLHLSGSSSGLKWNAFTAAGSMTLWRMMNPLRRHTSTTCSILRAQDINTGLSLLIVCLRNQSSSA